MISPHGERLRACGCCGLVQRAPSPPSGWRALCARCGCPVARGGDSRSVARTAAFSAAALILYPLAMTLPVIEVERMGHRHSATIWSGAVDLVAGGHLAIGAVVFVCSIVIPLAKIGGMFVLCVGMGGRGALGRRRRMLTYRTIEWIGRWGMIDVLLVAVLVAAVKLGDWVQVHPGPGAVAFGGVVLLSLLASASFDPLQIWEHEA